MQFTGMVLQAVIQVNHKFETERLKTVGGLGGGRWSESDKEAAVVGDGSWTFGGVVVDWVGVRLAANLRQSRAGGSTLLSLSEMSWDRSAVERR